MYFEARSLLAFFAVLSIQDGTWKVLLYDRKNRLDQIAVTGKLIAIITIPMAYAPWKNAKTAEVRAKIPATRTSVTIAIIVTHVALPVGIPFFFNHIILTNSPPTNDGVVDVTNSLPILTETVFQGASTFMLNVNPIKINGTILT